MGAFVRLSAKPKPTPQKFHHPTWGGGGGVGLGWVHVHH